MKQCPTCGKSATTWYECLKCGKTMCNACYFKASNRCPSCSYPGKKNVKK
ncbi:MAG: hypothetical protein FWD57_07650 [Polyangiaceae bacterium]|nr:hypothetical protein [Polyangiaceae bacterium]